MDEKRAAQQSEYELEAEVERYNTVFQKIFGIVFQKIGDHVYDFMDRVVLHLSPETLPYLSGMSIVNEARIDFDQLLNNLIASGSARPGRDRPATCSTSCSTAGSTRSRASSARSWRRRWCGWPMAYADSA